MGHSWRGLSLPDHLAGAHDGVDAREVGEIGAGSASRIVRSASLPSVMVPLLSETPMREAGFVVNMPARPPVETAFAQRLELASVE